MEISTQSVQKGEQFSATQMGPLDQLDQFTLSLASLPKAVRGKVFLNEALDMSSMEVSLNKFPPGVTMPFWHKHRQCEELYLFLGGTGEFQVDDTVIPLTEGTVIFVKPDARRIWRNTSPSQALYFIVIQAVAGTFSQKDIEDGVHLHDALPWSAERIQ